MNLCKFEGGHESSDIHLSIDRELWSFFFVPFLSAYTLSLSKRAAARGRALVGYTGISSSTTSRSQRRWQDYLGGPSPGCRWEPVQMVRPQGLAASHARISPIFPADDVS